MCMQITLSPLPTLPVTFKLAALLSLFATAAFAQPLPNPILFVTQVPVPEDFATIGSTFGNHRTQMLSVGRGGDLVIRYPDGSLRFLTQEAGYGASGQQGGNAIAVRDPAIDDSGTKAVFSMVIGAPSAQFEVNTYYWQLYQVSGLGKSQTAVITRVPNQPANFNNINPAYLPDGSIVFASDRPRNGAAHLYPQLDEYDEAATVSGLWRLFPATGALTLLKPAPSGSFHPIVDSFGRVLFTRWDHLQRDQQAEKPVYGSFNYSDESAASLPTTSAAEVFPELRLAAPASTVEGLVFNQFFPWQMNQDGSEEETLNHVGRHELHSYFDRSFNTDPDLHEFNPPPTRPNQNSIQNMLQLREDPTAPGRYYAIDSPEFDTHASGQIIHLRAEPGLDADNITIDYITPRDTWGVVANGDPIPADDSGHYRDPLPLSDGQIIAAHTSQTHAAANLGTDANPVSNYDFRLKRLAADGSGYLAPVENLTTGISKSISYWSPDILVSYNGPLWELSPVEVRARATPPVTAFALKAPEQQAFALENVDINAFRAYLKSNGQALIVMRDVTSRDRADQQQPYNLRVPGGVQTIGNAGLLYDIAHMQFFQADHIRGLGIVNPGDTPSPGRRVLAQTLHDIASVHINAFDATGPAGSTMIAADGSVAMVVPADRPLAWQSTAPNGAPVVRERYWISFQPGEIRACDGCHGVNTANQAGQPAATNVATALRALLARFRNRQIDLIFNNEFEVR